MQMGNLLSLFSLKSVQTVSNEKFTYKSNDYKRTKVHVPEAHNQFMSKYYIAEPNDVLLLRVDTGQFELH